MSVKASYILALDLGTTGNRAFIFDRSGRAVGKAYKELTQYYPQPGWWEHDATEIWEAVVWVMQKAIADAKIEAKEIAAIGLSVQRETCLLWDKNTGKPLHRAIVWQDRRTASNCAKLRKEGRSEEVYQRTGLPLDPYFSATKLAWLIEHLPEIDLDSTLAGTIDAWILWNLTGRKVHATDRSNASRTILFHLTDCQWDDRLLDLFGVPPQLLPQVQPSRSEFGVTEASLLGVEIPITAILGDQQASLFGHGCDRPGLMKCTYGTGAFLVAHTGSEVVRSCPQLISTIAESHTTSSGSVEVEYALEGSMFGAGACIQWLRDGLKLIENAQEIEQIAQSVPDSGGVYFVPALSGLGAPHWDLNARGAFMGLTAGVERSHIVRSVLEAIAYQVKDVVDAVNKCSDTPLQQLRVDGGVAQNDFLMQLQADLLGIPVIRPAMPDITAWGIALAAGLQVGFWDRDPLQESEKKSDSIFELGEGSASALDNFVIWQKAVDMAKNWL